MVSSSPGHTLKLLSRWCRGEGWHWTIFCVGGWWRWPCIIHPIKGVSCSEKWVSTEGNKPDGWLALLGWFYWWLGFGYWLEVLSCQVAIDWSCPWVWWEECINIGRRFKRLDGETPQWAMLWKIARSPATESPTYTVRRDI
jgi:hypothetical protein